VCQNLAVIITQFLNHYQLLYRDCELKIPFILCGNIILNVITVCLNTTTRMFYIYLLLYSILLTRAALMYSERINRVC